MLKKIFVGAFLVFSFLGITGNSGEAHHYNYHGDCYNNSDTYCGDYCDNENYRGNYGRGCGCR